MASKSSPADVTRLRSVALFADLDEPDLVTIASGATQLDMPRAARVLSRGDQLEGLYAVLSGSLKLYMLSCNGDERVLRVMRDGDSFGEAIMFNAIPSPVFVDTLTPAQLLYLPRAHVADALARHPDFTTSMLRNMSGLMRDLIADLDACCLQNAAQRIASFLLREAGCAAALPAQVCLPAAKAVVASTLNVSAETFSRELHRLQHDGVIRVERRVIHIDDRAALEALASGGAVAAKRCDG